MRLKLEVIDGRKGYLQRVIGQDDKGVRMGYVGQGIDESIGDHNDGRESSGVSGAGERDGTATGRNQGDNGRGARHNLPQDGILELLLFQIQENSILLALPS